MHLILVISAALAAMPFGGKLKSSEPPHSYARQAHESRQARKLTPPSTEAMVVTTAWLAQHLHDPHIVVIEVTDERHQVIQSHATPGHIPGSRDLPFGLIIVTRDGLDWELPPVDSLQSVFEALGVSNSSHVIVYAPELPMAARALMTLDYLGLKHFALLNGGLEKWVAEGRPVSPFGSANAHGHLTPHARPEMIVTANRLSTSAGLRNLALIDTRSDVEYLGTGEHRGMPSKGHLQGARQLQWQQLTVQNSPALLLDRAQLASLFSARVPARDTVVTYCWVGYRASATYFVARYLGYPVRLYDGSYQDWLRRGLPVRSGGEP